MPRFSVTFYPGNNSLMVGFDGVSYIEGKVVAEMTLTVAVKLLLSIHTVRALDSRSLTAEASGARKATKQVYFSVTFYPGNNSLMVGFDGVSYIEGKVVAEMTLMSEVPSGRSRESGPKSMGPADMGHIPMPAIEQGLILTQMCGLSSRHSRLMKRLPVSRPRFPTARPLISGTV
jgi:hypothetical protein